MAWEYFTLGGSEILYDVFHGVAELTSGPNYLKLLSIMALLGATWALVINAFGGSFRGTVAWFTSFFIIYNVMFLPKVTVVITDPLNPETHRSVENVPISLGVIASLASQVGKSLTEGVEAVFTTVSDLRYQKTGMLFGSRLISSASSAKISDSNFAASINSFVKQCVFYDILLHKYSFEDLKNSSNIWEFMGANPSPARSFEIKSKAGSKIVTCAAGINELGQQNNWNSESNSFMTTMSKSLFPMTSTNVINDIAIRNKVLTALPQTYESFFGFKKDAVEAIKQNMLINAIDMAAADFSGIGSTANIYTDVRSNMQTKAAFKAGQRQAEHWLPILKIVFEILFFGAFPIVFILFMLPIGAQAVKGYFLAFLWLQSWAPLYAILNRIMTGYAASKTLAVTGGAGITIATHAAVMNINQDIAEMAGYLAWSIPFISAGLATGIVSSATSLATSMLSVPQSATNTAAAEASTGNISLGNMSIANSNYENLSANKLNDSAFFDNGRMQVVNSMGGLTSMNAHGDYASNQSGAITQIPNLNMRMSEMHSSQLLQSAGASETAGLSASSNAAMSKMHSIDQATQNMASHTFSENSNHDYQKGWTAQEREAYSHYEASANDFSKAHNIDKSVALKILGAAGGKVGNSGVLSGSLGMNLDYTGGKSVSDLYKEAESFSNQHRLDNDISLITDAVSRRGFSEQDSRSNSLQNSVSDSMREAHSYEEQSRAYFDKAESLREEAQYTRSNSFAIDRDLTNSMVHWASKQKDKYGHEFGHERIVSMLASPTERSRANTERLINSFVETSEAKNIIASHHSNSKNSLGEIDPPTSYKTFESSLPTDVGSIANGNANNFGFSNKSLKQEVAENRANSQAHIKSAAIDSKIKAEIGQKRDEDMIDIFHYTEAGNPKNTKEGK